MSEIAYNTTTSAYNMIATTPTMTGVVIVTLLISVVIALLLSNDKCLKYLYGFIRFLKNTFGYFFYGVVSSIFLTLATLFVRMNMQQVKSGNPYIIKGFAIVVIGYLLLSAFGWCVKTFVVDRIRATHIRVLKSNLKNKRKIQALG
jgi:hypothetical protein